MVVAAALYSREQNGISLRKETHFFTSENWGCSNGTSEE
jgi:hypothetical protein